MVRCFTVSLLFIAVYAPYFLINTNFNTWQQARDACIAQNSHLATFCSSQDISTLSTICKSGVCWGGWIGDCSGSHDDSAHSFIDGTPFASVGKWCSHQPDNCDSDAPGHQYGCMVQNSACIYDCDNGYSGHAMCGYSPSCPTQTTAPSNAPSAPTQPPSTAPSIAPSIAPTQPPSISPTQPPSISPTQPPSISPTQAPTQPPSISPSIAPTRAPSIAPTQAPSIAPTQAPSIAPHDSSDEIDAYDSHSMEEFDSNSIDNNEEYMNNNYTNESSMELESMELGSRVNNEQSIWQSSGSNAIETGFSESTESAEPIKISLQNERTGAIPNTDSTSGSADEGHDAFKFEKIYDNKNKNENENEDDDNDNDDDMSESSSNELFNAKAQVENELNQNENNTQYVAIQFDKSVIHIMVGLCIWLVMNGILCVFCKRRNQNAVFEDAILSNV